MLTIVTCSTKPDLLASFSKNVEDTIGVPYEIISIDNRENKYSIFQAYNIGLEKSKYPFVVFVHEDVAFRTQDWGNIIVELFDRNERLGLLGICGAGYKTKAPSNWWANASENFNFQYISHLKNGKIERNIWGWDSIDPKITEMPVVVIDGVFMVLRKSSNIRFNEQLQGFHNYDVSLCVDVLDRNFEIAVTRQIELIHFSEGTLNDAWLESTYHFYQLYKNKLPQKLSGVSLKSSLEINNYVQFITRSFLSGYKNIGMYFWREMWRQFPFSGKHLIALKYYFRCRKH